MPLESLLLSILLPFISAHKQPRQHDRKAPARERGLF